MSVSPHPPDFESDLSTRYFHFLWLQLSTCQFFWASAFSGKLHLSSLTDLQPLLVHPSGHPRFPGDVSFFLFFRCHKPTCWCCQFFPPSSWLSVWWQVVEECCFNRELLSVKGSGRPLASPAETSCHAGRLGLIQVILFDWQLLNQAFLHIFIAIITSINMNDDSVLICDSGTWLRGSIINNCFSQ